jgi:ribosomal protein S18 acetylase RimI-like enzyme
MRFEKIYLQLFRADWLEAPQPADTQPGFSLRHLLRPDYACYRAWHDAVGRPWGWHLRKRIRDRARVESELTSLGAKMSLLCMRGKSIGYCLVQYDLNQDAEIADFGLLPQCTGCGHGTIFLGLLLEQMWRKDRSRVWLSTRSTNHPRVVEFYRRFGFREFRPDSVDASQGWVTAS